MSQRNILLLAVCFFGAVLTCYGLKRNLTEEEIIFKNYTNWKGYYFYKENAHFCSMETKLLSGGIVSGQLTDDNEAVIAMSGTTFEGMKVIFSKVRVVNGSDRFPTSTSFNFMVIGTLHPSNTYVGWTFVGNVTQPQGGPFTSLILTAHNGIRLATTTPVNEALRVGLTVGISLGLGLLSVAVMTGITVWAIRKGYLRHVPLTYSNFQNERTNYNAKDDSLHI